MTYGAEEFTAFVRAHSRQLQRAAWLLTGDWASAEDLVQSALLRTWQHWDSVRVPEARAAYARRVLMTTFLNRRRRRRLAEVPLAADAGNAVEGVDLADRDALFRALRALPSHQRAVVVLRYFDDLTERAAAEVLGCGVGTVKSQTARALRALRADPDLLALFVEERQQ